jgi:peptide/nickel transport system ATP-binding protein
VGAASSPLRPPAPAGCAFAANCPRVGERCRSEKPQLEDTGAGRVACFNPES